MALESLSKEPSMRIKTNGQQMDSMYSCVASCSDGDDVLFQQQFCDNTTDTSTLLKMYEQRYNQLAERDCITSIGTVAQKHHRYESSTGGGDLVLYNEGATILWCCAIIL
jgi:hypothetical protein